ncbi:hypothetical protein [Geodermatophilus sp. URMC 65]
MSWRAAARSRQSVDHHPVRTGHRPCPSAFPAAGNGGYDVGHYDLTLSYDPATGRPDGTAVVTLTGTADLDLFSLDLRGLTATSVTVDGTHATVEQQPPGEW